MIRRSFLGLIACLPFLRVGKAVAASAEVDNPDGLPVLRHGENGLAIGLFDLLMAAPPRPIPDRPGSFGREVLVWLPRETPIKKLWFAPGDPAPPATSVFQYGEMSVRHDLFNNVFCLTPPDSAQHTRCLICETPKTRNFVIRTRSACCSLDIYGMAWGGYEFRCAELRSTKQYGSPNAREDR